LSGRIIPFETHVRLILKLAICVLFFSFRASLSFSLPENIPTPQEHTCTYSNSSPTQVSSPEYHDPASCSKGSSSGLNSGEQTQPVVSITPQRIIVNSPPTEQSAWTFHDKIAWASGLILTVLCYCGLMFGLHYLRIMVRHQEQITESLTDVQESLHSIQSSIASLYRVERPWISVSVKQSSSSNREYDIYIKNHGNAPALLSSIQKCIGVSEDPTIIPSEPTFSRKLTLELIEDMILQPGESMVLLSFNRNDVRWICNSERLQQQMEMEFLHILLYGSVEYRHLISSDIHTLYQTTWCSRYVHNDEKSGLHMVETLHTLSQRCD